jgi:hypothetical protein
MRVYRSCIRILFFTALAALVAVPAFSFEFAVDTSQNFTADEQYQRINTALTHDFYDFRFITDLSYYTDDKYSPMLSGRFSGGYFFMEQGGLTWEKGDFDASIGRLDPVQMVDSPYSLFVNSTGRSTITANYAMKKEHFFFRSQWLRLNHNSTIDTDTADLDNGPATVQDGGPGFDEGFPDRGVNMRFYGLQFGDLRFGYQEAAVYTERSFDLEYLVNPLPAFFIQYVNISDGKPWQHGQDENTLIGFYFDYTRPDYYIYSQLLIDDINLNFLFPDSYVNPSKVAWSLGGSYELRQGTVGFYHAGATKYTFQPNKEPYGYTYYPDTVFLLDNDDEQSIAIEENYIGYKYGENNLAFLLFFKPEYRPSKIELAGSMEFVLSGAKSPVNPWHQYTDYKQGGEYSKMFTESRIEKRLSLTLDAQRPISKSFSAYGSLELGYVWNSLDLVPGLVKYESEYTSSDDYEPGDEYDIQYLQFWKPSSDSDPIINFTIGVRYAYNPF